MKLTVVDLFSKEEDKVKHYYAVVESKFGKRVVTLPKRRFLRAKVGQRVEVTLRELNDANTID